MRGVDQHQRSADSLLRRFQAWRDRHPTKTGLSLSEWWASKVELGLENHNTATFAETNFRLRVINAGTASANAGWDSLDPGVNQPTTIYWDTKGNYVIRVRFEIDETAGGSTNQSFTLEYRHNGGTWTTIGTATSVARLYDGTATDGTATNNIISGSSRSFLAGEYKDTGATTGNISFSGNQHTEIDWSVELVDGDLAENDTVEFRVNEPTTHLATPPQVTWGPPNIVVQIGTISESNTLQAASVIQPETAIGWYHVYRRYIGPFKDSSGLVWSFGHKDALAGDFTIQAWSSNNDGGGWLVESEFLPPVWNILVALGNKQTSDFCVLQDVNDPDLIHIFLSYPWVSREILPPPFLNGTPQQHVSHRPLWYLAFDTINKTWRHEPVDETRSYSQGNAGGFHAAQRSTGEFIWHGESFTYTNTGGEGTLLRYTPSGIDGQTGDMSVVTLDTTSEVSEPTWSGHMVLADKNDDVHVLFHGWSFLSSNKGIWHRVLRASDNTLSSTQRITTLGESNNYPATSCITDDKIFIAQKQGDDGPFVVWNSDGIGETPNWSSTTMETSPDLSPAGSGNGMTGVVAGNEHICIAIWQFNGGTIRYRWWNPSTETWDSEVDSGDTPAAADQPTEGNAIFYSNNYPVAVYWAETTDTSKGEQHEAWSYTFNSQVVPVGTIEEVNDPAVRMGQVTELKETETLVDIFRKQTIFVQVGTLREVNHPAWIKTPDQAPEFYSPDADVSNPGNWTPTPLFEQVDEVIPNDSDSITTGNLSSGATAACTIGLPPVTDSKTNAGWTLYVRARKGNNTYSGSFTVRLNRVSDGTILGNWSLTANPNPDPWHDFVLSTSYQTFALPLDDRGWIQDDTDYEVYLQGSAPFFSGQFQSFTVSWVRLETASTTPATAGPDMGSMTLHPYGKSGPVELGGKTWMLAYEPSLMEAWLYSATNPSDGHVPSEWTPERLIFKHSQVKTLFRSELASDGTNLMFALIWESRHQFPWVHSAYNQYKIYNSSAELIGSTELQGMYQRESASQSEPNHPDNLHFGSIEYRPTADEYIYIQWNTGAGDNGNWYVARWDITTDPEDVIYTDWFGNFTAAQPMVSVQGTSDRVHYFWGTGANSVGGVRQRTVRANGSYQSTPASHTGGDRVLWAEGDVTSGGLVAIPFRAPAGGIYASVLTSADSPTTTEEQVTDRMAHRDTYGETSVGVADGTAMMVFWIDAESGDAIYYSERLGTDSWTEETLGISAKEGRTKLSATQKIAGTIALVTSTAGTGTIEYYEIDPIPPGQTVNVGTIAETDSLLDVPITQPKIVAIGTLAETDTLIEANPEQPNIIDVGTIAETDTLNSIAGITTVAVGTISESETLYEIRRVWKVGTISEVEVLQDVSTTTIVEISVWTGDVDSDTGSGADTATGGGGTSGVGSKDELGLQNVGEGHGIEGKRRKRPGTRSVKK